MFFQVTLKTINQKKDAGEAAEIHDSGGIIWQTVEILLKHS